MKRNSIVARFSVGLNKLEVEALEKALITRHGYPCLNSRNRGAFLQIAVWAFSNAVIRSGKDYDCSMLACDVRHETPDEYADRIGEPRQQQQLAFPPDNIVQLFPAEEANAAS
jgi:hypothetical protein